MPMSRQIHKHDLFIIVKIDYADEYIFTFVYYNLYVLTIIKICLPVSFAKNETLFIRLICFAITNDW